MAFENLIVERDGAVAVVMVNRPAVLNALSRATLADLDACLAELGRDDASRVIVLTGAGDKAFVAGADINELATLSPADGREYALRGQRVFSAIERLGKPVIAAVNGFALGGGCELAMACTIRLASEHARFGQPEIKLGLIPGFAGTQRLPRLIGKGRAMELVLTGAMIDAREAWRIGLVNAVFPAPELRGAAMKMAQGLAASAPVAIRYAMDAIDRGLEMTQAEGCAMEAALFGLVVSTDDMREGTRAFLEKRKAEFKGR
jgi:enoyl-CoA hydratase